MYAIEVRIQSKQNNHSTSQQCLVCGLLDVIAIGESVRYTFSLKRCAFN